MPGLYVHIPFCHAKCAYCDFVSFAGREADMRMYADRLAAEMMEKGRLVADTVFDTVFIGGGTPSCLAPDALETILDALCGTFNRTADCEFTCEMNPQSGSDVFLRRIAGYGVNRVSMGVQAIQPHILKVLGRRQPFALAEECFERCRFQGIPNINADLMLGVPTQSMADLSASLRAVLALAPTHVSCYGLIPEPGTPLETALAERRLTLPDEEEERAMYAAAAAMLEAAGLARYEISNFALPGYACRHNIGYWRQEPYVGLGLAAHGLWMQDGVPVRTANTEDLDAYLSGVTQISAQAVSAADWRFETLMLGLRMQSGVSADFFYRMHGLSLYDAYGEKIAALAEEGLLDVREGGIRLTERGFDVQNTVLVALMD